MQSTTRFEPSPTISHGGRENATADPGLITSYEKLSKDRKITWTSHYHMLRLLGRGGQGEVYLTEVRGTDGFTVPLAMKIFSPERYPGANAYRESMKRIASIAARIALIQHDNLLEVQNFFERSQIRIMLMEWVDGYDVRQLMSPRCLSTLNGNVDPSRWEYINQVILTEGPKQSRFKAGFAIAIARQALSAMAALHREGIVHGDIKPANIMLKRSGYAKLIDMGSAIDFDDPPRERECTPMYAAPEVLENRAASPQSDLASLGYVLVELLAGQNPFDKNAKLRDLLASKRELPNLLPTLLPDEVVRNELLMKFIQKLIAPDPNKRYSGAEAAELDEGGAAEFHRQLVHGELATEYHNEIRLWLDELRALETDIEDFDI